MNILPTVRLNRIEESSQGTFGVLTICSHVFCVTLELPDRLNMGNVSCIPAQQYMCKKVESPRFGKTFKIDDVPDRSFILFHAGNTINSSKGCIILAQYYGKLQGERAVLNSGDTFKKFMQIMKDVNDFSLTIKECY